MGWEGRTSLRGHRGGTRGVEDRGGPGGGGERVEVGVRGPHVVRQDGIAAGPTAGAANDRAGGGGLDSGWGDFRIVKFVAAETRADGEEGIGRRSIQRDHGSV